MANAADDRIERGAQAQSSDQPREGGWGIVVVVAAHLSLAIQWGFQRAGGVLYLSWKEDFDTKDKETAAVQSIFSSLSCFTGLFAGMLTDRLGCRVSGIIGGVLTSLGLFCSYWVTDIVQLYCTAAIIGIGMGICYNSIVVVVAIYFKRRYKIAHALVYAGVGTGIMAVPPLLQLLLESYGWRGTLLVASGITANSIALSALFRPNRAPVPPKSFKQPDLNHQGLTLRVRVHPETTKEDATSGDHNSDEKSRHDEIEVTRQAHRALPDSQTDLASVQSDPKNVNPVIIALKRVFVSLGFHLFVKSYRFTLMCAIQLESHIAYMGFVIYLVPRAQSVGVAPSNAAFLLSIFGIGSLLGRLGNGLLVSWRVSAEHVTAISMVIAGASLLLLNLEGYAIFAIASFLHGLLSGIFFTVAIVLIHQFVGVNKLAVGVGLNMIFVGIGSLTGPVFAGWILDMTDSSYQTVFYVLSAVYFICGVQMFLLPQLKRVEPGI
ncbi:monocarboxylate transporter 12-B-like [Acanthaster planci]|uniref:Monocarboxylate transporter 12-B-like n=1 Tax=Acanthaster planci TaxID=133434 RepID=A0A8B7Y6C9_ACAPL|nr:monocarboxylate transporter 12-B-like [Acanthaster planci]XP_022088107.1 monocarboxylate transporter 12-B-like [Acanthaster planci]